jgi:hypothetical protein
VIYGAATAAHDDLAIARANVRDLENQLCRIARVVGRDATEAPEQDRTIAGATIELIQKLRAALLAAKISHHVCEDCWYSCPLSSEGCCDERETECNCGAEKHNAAIDFALSDAGEQK